MFVFLTNLSYSKLCIASFFALSPYDLSLYFIASTREIVRFCFRSFVYLPFIVIPEDPFGLEHTYFSGTWK